MNRHIHIDPLGGMAGDMFAAAMLDAFPDLEAPLRSDLQAAGILDHVRIDLQDVGINGIAARRFIVTPSGGPARSIHHYRDIKAFLVGSGLDRAVCARALAIFDCLAEAEGRVHGVAPDAVHFHEVADWDSIADIVAAASLILHSGATSWTCAALPMGSGIVRTEHGSMPVPAPATTLLLEGFALYDDGEAGERVTPTGAAILRHLMASNSQPRPTGSLARSGSGGGAKRFKSLPNIVRLLVLDAAGEDLQRPLHDRIGVLAFEVDDMTPEELAMALEHLNAAPGVVDAGYHLRQGKKGRPQFAVRVLADPDCIDAVADLCFTETSTLGLRVEVAARRILRRDFAKVQAGERSVTVKRAFRPDGAVTAKVEADDLADVTGHDRRRTLAGAGRQTDD